MIPCHILLLVTTSALVIIYFLHFPAQWEWLTTKAKAAYQWSYQWVRSLRSKGDQK